MFTFTAKTSIRQTKCTAPSTNHCHRDGGTKGEQGVTTPSQILIYMATLSKPRGQIPTRLVLTPQIVKPSAICCHALSSERSAVQPAHERIAQHFNKQQKQNQLPINTSSNENVKLLNLCQIHMSN